MIIVRHFIRNWRGNKFLIVIKVFFYKSIEHINTKSTNKEMNLEMESTENDIDDYDLEDDYVERLTSRY